MIDGLCSNDREPEDFEEPARFTNSQDTLRTLPWSDHDRAADCTRVYKYLLDNPSGVPLTHLCEALFGDLASDDRTYSSRDYEFTRRFLETCEIGRLERSSGLLEAEPTLEAFHLTHGKQISYPDGETPTNNRDETQRAGIEDIGLSHKDFARKLTQKLDRVDSIDQARALVNPYLRYLESIEDTYIIMEDQMMPQENYLLLPYRTRFNDTARVSDQWRRYHTAWDKSLELGHDRGLHLTLTTDPNRYDCLADMVDGLFTGWGKLLEALNQRADQEERLPFIRALEFTGSEKSGHPGLPHLHVVVFGLGYLSHDWLKNYWDSKADHGKHVWIEPLHRRDNTWLHKNNTSQEGQTVNAKAYLGEYLSKTFEDIEDSAEQHFTEVDDWSTREEAVTSSLWKMALYWATGRQFWDSSHSLKEETVETLQDVPGLGETKLDRLAEAGVRTLSDVRLSTKEELSSIDGLGDSLVADLLDLAGEPNDFDLGRWVFVGAASYENIPAHVTMNATLSGGAIADGATG